MKRIVCVACLVAVLLSACSVIDQELTITEDDYTYGVYQLTFKAKLISNDSVGDDWSFTYTYNGETIKNGHQITQSMEIFSFQTIDVAIREDDKIDDVGSGVLRVAICDGGSGKTEITVVEQGGKYNGNTAVWEITCEVKLVGKK